MIGLLLRALTGDGDKKNMLCADTAASAVEQARQRGLPQLWRSLRQLHRPAAAVVRRGSPVKAFARAGSPALSRGSPAKVVLYETAMSASPMAAEASNAGTLVRPYTQPPH